MPNRQRKRAPQNELLPDESSDIRKEASKFFDNADVWLQTENSNLAGRTPNDLIGSGNEAIVRDLLRRIKYIGVL